MATVCACKGSLKSSCPLCEAATFLLGGMARHHLLQKLRRLMLTPAPPTAENSNFHGKEVQKVLYFFLALREARGEREEERFTRCIPLCLMAKPLFSSPKILSTANLGTVLALCRYIAFFFHDKGSKQEKKAPEGSHRSRSLVSRLRSHLVWCPIQVSQKRSKTLVDPSSSVNTRSHSSL